jgi:hypothetical protein
MLYFEADLKFKYLFKFLHANIFNSVNQHILFFQI